MPLAPARFGPNHEELPGGPKPLETTQDVVDRIGELQAAGVTSTTIVRPGPAPASLEAYLENLHWAAEEVIPKVG
jgi:hypothetical protein